MDKICLLPKQILKLVKSVKCHRNKCELQMTPQKVAYITKCSDSDDECIKNLIRTINYGIVADMFLNRHHTKRRAQTEE